MSQEKSLLSIIILNLNTKEITKQAIKSIEESYPKEVKDGTYEVILVDNASTDGSQETFKEFEKTTTIKKFHLVLNTENTGFSAGNNKGLEYSDGEYILFLNSDTIVNDKVFPYMINFLKEHPDAGAATCKVVLRSGKIDDASHRGFPTPWNSFCHFSGLSKIFPKTKLFGSYSMTYIKNMEEDHEIDALAGAFMIMPRSTGEKVGWWDSEFFLYGEDLDFCYRIKQKRMKVYYVPEVEILHLKGTSLGIRKESRDISTADKERKIKSQIARFNSMKIFYKKHYLNKYPKIITKMVFLQIEIMRWLNIRKYK